jgi:hypothetical protein
MIAPIKVGNIAGNTDRVYEILVPARIIEKTKMINKEKRFRKNQKTCKAHNRQKKEKKAPDSS